MICNRTGSVVRGFPALKTFSQSAAEQKIF
jgi:hypothetical protein